MNSMIEKNTRLGFIGMDDMGSRMAIRLLKHGYHVGVYDRSREAAQAIVKHGASVADSIAMLASEADIILSSLTDDDAVKHVYTGPKGVLANIGPGSAIIEMSTISPLTSRELARLCFEAGVKFLDSPVSGSTPAAELGTLTLFCGGDEHLFDAAQSIFSAIASQSFFLGSGGSGTAMKLVANTLLGVGMQALAESIALGEKEGLDRHRLLNVLERTAVVAPALLGKLPAAEIEDYNPQFPIQLMSKDFALILEAAAAGRVPMPATAASFQANIAELTEGKEEDFSAVITLMERLARVNPPAPAEPKVLDESARVVLAGWNKRSFREI